MTALADRVATPVDRADFDDLVTLVTQAPPWEKDRAAGVRILLRAIGEGKADAPDQILARWTWRLARATRKIAGPPRERRSSRRRSGCSARVANSRGHRHEENVGQLVKVAARDAAPGRRRAPRLGRGLHAAGERRCSTAPARSSARSRRSRTRSPTTSRRRRRRRASRAGAQAQAARPAEAAAASEHGGDDGRRAAGRARARRDPAAVGRPGSGVRRAGVGRRRVDG